MAMAVITGCPVKPGMTTERLAPIAETSPRPAVELLGEELLGGGGGFARGVGIGSHALALAAGIVEAVGGARIEPDLDIAAPGLAALDQGRADARRYLLVGAAHEHAD